MKSKKKALAGKENSFEKAVNATKQISGSYQKGLQALGQYANKITLGDTRQCQGSVDIDSAVERLHSGENRWDYCFCYKNEALFVEVHPANTSDVSVVLNKLTWLVNWLNEEAPEINKLKAKSMHPFYWIQTKGFHIPPTSRQFRQVVEKGLKPINLLKIK
ncbi:MAG: hypothetical protein DI535_20150 [Citrobacter freundii]|nr:MAG: hypothetical protein DI535_20150 [Citrobacter freundii]